MGYRLEFLLFLLTSCISFALFLAMRKSMVRGGFALLWLLICIALVSLPFMETFYRWLSGLMGFNYASDMLALFAILFLMVYVFYLTSKLQKVSDAAEIILSRCAILESHVNTLVSLKREDSARSTEHKSPVGLENSSKW